MRKTIVWYHCDDDDNDNDDDGMNVSTNKVIIITIIIIILILDKFISDINLLSNRPQFSLVYRLINHAGCWKNTRRIRESRAAAE